MKKKEEQSLKNAMQPAKQSVALQPKQDNNPTTSHIKGKKENQSNLDFTTIDFARFNNADNTQIKYTWDVASKNEASTSITFLVPNSNDINDVKSFSYFFPNFAKGHGIAYQGDDPITGIRYSDFYFKGRKNGELFGSIITSDSEKDPTKPQWTQRYIGLKVCEKDSCLDIKGTFIIDQAISFIKMNFNINKTELNGFLKREPITNGGFDYLFTGTMKKDDNETIPFIRIRNANGAMQQSGISIEYTESLPCYLAPLLTLGIFPPLAN